MFTIKERKLVYLLVDLVAAVVAGLAAYIATASLVASPNANLQVQIVSMVGLGALLLACAYLNELLDDNTAGQRTAFLLRWAQAWVVGMALFTTFYFIAGSEWNLQEGWGIRLTRISPLLFGFLFLGFFPLGRFAVRRTFPSDRSRRSCFVVGAGKSAAEFLRLLEGRRSNWQVLGLVDDDPQKRNASCEGYPILAPIDDLPKLCAASGVSDLILAVNSPLRSDSLDAIMRCFEKGAAILPVTDAVERSFGRVPIHCLGNNWLPNTFWATSDAPLIQRLIKRGLDIATSLGLLVLVLPLYSVLLPVAWLLHGRPLFYRQERVGQAGRFFTLVKMRSMQVDAEKDGARWADKNDARVTPLGRWLRLTRLDELPQLWNVLKGDMSLVGPRPERPEFVAVLEEKIPFYRARLAAKPGLTGWAQIKLGYTSGVDDAKTKLEYDLYYVKNQSIWLDLLILFRTIRTVLAHQGQ
jgi:exopolysaccharide biosynthesis polyprenyl glycosylphosphotransferase